MRAGSRSCSAWVGIVRFMQNRRPPRTSGLLVGRKLLQGKLLDVELSIRGILRGYYGLKVGEVSRGRFEARVHELIAGHATLSMVIGGVLAARAASWSEFMRLHREMLKIARADKICQRLITTSGVGGLSR